MIKVGVANIHIGTVNPRVERIAGRLLSPVPTNETISGMISDPNVRSEPGSSSEARKLRVKRNSTLEGLL